MEEEDEAAVAGRPSKNRRQQDRRPRGSRLVETFSEFLAGRNVINRSSIYDKIVNDNCDEEQQDDKQQSWRSPEILAFNRRPLVKSSRSGGRTASLLAALFSRRHSNKGWLLLSLLRAPVVLAAMFSLLLVATLMILYALMGVHQHRLAVNLTIGGHHLNSRHLEALYDGLSDFDRARAVQTECGTYVGEPEQRTLAFRGIPYASPPVGHRRWTRPRPVHLDPDLCRPGKSRPARHRSHCAQLSPMSQRFSGHEDCLYLDIYSARLDPVKKLPVMVYIHGGFLGYGNGRQMEQDEPVNWHPTGPSGSLASELNVVLVAFNFRLQALGFLTLEELAQNNGPDGAMGNYGLWDQLAALQWIQRNIELFGGDPDNVILFGPDSASALPLVAANQPNAWPDWGSLFRAAWLVNPTVYYKLPYELASRHYRRLFLNKDSPCSWRTPTNQTANASSPVGCLVGLSGEQVSRFYLAKDDPGYRLDDQNCMPIHGIFAEQFVTVEHELVQDSYWPFGSSRQPDEPSKSVTEHSSETNESAANEGPPYERRRSRRPRDWLLGSSAQATQYWACPRDLNLWSWIDFQRYVSTSLSSFSSDAYAEAARVYELPNKRTSPELTYLTMVSDIRQMCPAGQLAEALQLDGERVQRYVVETGPSEPVRLLLGSDGANSSRELKFAFHQWDLIALFGFEQLKSWRPQKQDLEFQRQIRQMVARFVHNHDRSANKSSDILFTKDAKQLPLHKKPLKYKARECQMWRQQLGSSYAWVS